MGTKKKVGFALLAIMVFNLSSSYADSQHKYFPKTREELKAFVQDESINLGEIDTSAITDMAKLFEGSTRQDFSGIESWDTSKVKYMEYMFSKAKSFNQNINAWDVSKVKDMHSMFAVAESFNQPLDKWNTSSVKYMKEMFYGAKSFNQSLDSWNVKNVLDMRDIFGSSPLQNNPPKWYNGIKNRF